MPIVEAPDPDLPLEQGDILQGVRLYCTGKACDGDDASAKRFPDGKCLILSRPCNVAHSASIIVAAVSAYKGGTPSDADTFDKALNFLTTIRDGHRTPDLFYLGQLPDKSGRYCCRFDAVFTLEMPGKGHPRDSFVREHRIGRLTIEFARDLHLQLFRAFSSLGFDDHNWFPKEDLEWLVATGRKDLGAIEQKLRDAREAEARARAEGRQFNTSEIEKQRKSLEEMQAKLRPFEESLQRFQGV
jgi:hypothetical protein